MKQEAQNTVRIDRNLLTQLANNGFSQIEIKRIGKILVEGIRYQFDTNFTDPVWVQDLKSHIVEIEPGYPPSHKQHKVLFAQLHYFRFIIERIRRKICNSEQANIKLITAMLTWDNKQMQIRDYITTCNMGLVLNMAQNCKYGSLEYGELVSEGSMALLRVTECYDYRLGFHFSTYACRAIGKSFSRLAKKQYKLSRISYVNYDPALEIDTTCQQLREERVLDSIRQIRYYILGERGNLSEVEKKVLKMRFSVGEYNGNQMTLKDIGQELGLSKERIRQIQNQAVGKLSSIIRS